MSCARIQLRQTNKLIRNLGGKTNNLEITLESPTTVTTSVMFAVMNFHSFHGGKVCVHRDDHELDLIVRGTKLAHIVFVPYSEPKLRIQVNANTVTDTYQEAMLKVFLSAFTVLSSRLAKHELDLKAMFDYDEEDEEEEE